MLQEGVIFKTTITKIDWMLILMPDTTNDNNPVKKHHGPYLQMTV